MKNELKVLSHASNVAGVKKIINLVIDKNSPERKSIKMSNIKSCRSNGSSRNP